MWPFVVILTEADCSLSIDVKAEFEVTFFDRNVKLQLRISEFAISRRLRDIDFYRLHICWENDKKLCCVYNVKGTCQILAFQWFFSTTFTNLKIYGPSNWERKGSVMPADFSQLVISPEYNSESSSFEQTFQLIDNRFGKCLCN